MRVYISVDMEGIAGVVHESQTDPTTPAFAAEYARFRRLMTAEANAAVEGALAAGATRALVNDSHWFMRNLLAEELHQAAELVSGDPKPRSMMQEIDQPGGFDAALCIGYHARAGTRNAILDHTYADRIHEVRLNGKPVGELGLNAALAGVHGVPVALVSGDNLLDEEKLAMCAGGERAWREDADTVRDATGFPVGGVPPFGHREPLRVFVDEDLLDYDELWAAAGTPHVNFAITPSELVKATGGLVCDLAKRR